MVMSSNKIGRRAMKATQAGIDDILKSAQTSARATVESDMKADDTIKKATAPQKAQTRGEAFREARARGDKTFTYGGKSYHTRMAGEGASKSKTSGRPGTGAPSPKAADNPPAPKPKDTGATYRSQSGELTRSANRAAMRKNTASKVPERSDGTISRINAGWAANKENFAKRQEKKYGPSSSKGDGMFSGINAAWARTKDKFTKAQKAKGYAKGGKIDGIAIRGKTRAPMKKGK